MKTRVKKLRLHRETLRHLGTMHLRAAKGGTVFYPSEFPTQCPGLCQTGNEICGPVNTGAYYPGCPSYANCTGTCAYTFTCTC
jgi:hypothetical protein